MSDRKGELVPISNLPLDIRKSMRPGSPAFKSYAQDLEEDLGLPTGSLTKANFDFAPDTDSLGWLDHIAHVKAAGGEPQLSVEHNEVPPDKVPASVLAQIKAGAPKLPGNENLKAPPKLTGPQEGDYPDVGVHIYNPFTGQTHRIGVDLSQDWGNRAAALGKVFVDQGHGLTQRMAGPGAAEDAAVEAERRRLDAPLMSTPEGQQGYMAGTMGSAVAPQGALTRLGAEAQAARTAAQAARPLTGQGTPLWARAVPTGPVGQGAAVGAGLSAAQPVVPGESRALNAGEGAATGAVGSALPAGAMAWGRPAWEGLGTRMADLAQKAMRPASQGGFGIPLRSADMDPGGWLKRLYTGALDHLPFTGTNQLGEAQHSAFNRALSRKMGIDSDDVAQALQDSRVASDAAYTGLKSRNNLQWDPWHQSYLDTVRNDFAKTDLSPGKADTRRLAELARQIRDAAGPQGLLSGADYKLMRSQIGQEATGKSSAMQSALGEYKQTLDNAFRSGLSPADLDLSMSTDRNWANMKTLENMRPNANGDFDFSQLRNVLTARANANASNRSNYLYGTADPDLPDLADVGRTFLDRGLGKSPLNATQSIWKRMGKTAIGAGELGGLTGGLYALNHTEDNPIKDTSLDLGTVLLLGALAGRYNNSAGLARGYPNMVRLGRAAQGSGLNQLGTAALNSSKLDTSPPEDADAGGP